MSNQPLREISKELHPASFIFSLSSRQFSYVDAGLLSLLELNSQNLTLEIIRSMIHPEDVNHALKVLTSMLNELTSAHIQLRIVSQQKYKWIRVMAFTRCEGENCFVYGSAVDTTAERGSLEVYEKYANKKNAILNILAHDLTGPLSVINMLGSSLRSADPANAAQIQNILKINRQAIELIGQLTAREFLETAEIVLSTKRINISQKLREYTEEYQRSAAETARNFHFNSVPDNIFMYVDEPKIIQILNNLTTNALKFTKENGNIFILIEEHADTVLFEVTDDGIGIPEIYHPVLFDKFTAAARKGLQGEPSIGLGMYVIKNIVEWHGGTIGVDSKEGQGTTISFVIPK